MSNDEQIGIFKKMMTVICHPIKSVCRLIEKHQEFYNISIGFTAILTFLWAAYTFNVLSQKEKALSELDKANIELVEIRDRIKNSESSTIRIDAKQFKDDSGYYIYPIITIRNSGKKVLKLNIDKSLAVSKVSLEEDKAKATHSYTPHYYEIIGSSRGDSSKKFEYIEVPIDGERTLSYALKVQEQGSYYITFTAYPTDKEDEKIVDSRPLVWFSSIYINV